MAAGAAAMAVTLLHAAAGRFEVRDGPTSRISPKAAMDERMAATWQRPTRAFSAAMAQETKGGSDEGDHR
jgi:hypothetical protein